MLEESGRVVAVEDGRAWVEVARQGGCHSCDARQGCGQGMLAGFGQKALSVSVANRLGAQVGDVVVIGMGESALLRTAIRMYLLPLLALLAGAAAANRYGAPDSLVALSGFIALGLSFLALQVVGRGRGDVEYSCPLMLRIFGRY